MSNNKVYTNEEAKAMRGMRLTWINGKHKAEAYLAEVDLDVGITIKCYKKGSWSDGDLMEAGTDLTCIDTKKSYPGLDSSSELIQQALREVDAGERVCSQARLGVGVTCAFS